MSVPRLLVTGPTHALADYSNAARLANWEPIEYPLLEVVELPVDHELHSGSLPDRLILTSRNALTALENWCTRTPDLKSVPLDVVGEKHGGRGTDRRGPQLRRTPSWIPSPRRSVLPRPPFGSSTRRTRAAETINRFFVLFCDDRFSGYPHSSPAG